jgi:hypothetical protein
MVTRWRLALCISAATLALIGIPSGAAAGAPECPPGDWFCDEPPLGEEPDPSEANPDEAPPSDGEWSEPSSELPSRRGGPPPDIALSGPGPRREGWDPAGARSWGSNRDSGFSFNLRFEGVLLESQSRHEDAGMAGIGGSLRYRLNPVVTLDAGLDTLLGTDYNGYDRGELTLSFSSIFYFNPERTVRVYALVGLNASVARVNVGGDDQGWGYFGAHAGLGLDIPLNRRLAFDIALLGFLRGRTDDRAAREPEFTDESGRVTNTSGGGLFRAGINLSF